MEKLLLNKCLTFSGFMKSVKGSNCFFIKTFKPNTIVSIFYNFNWL